MYLLSICIPTYKRPDTLQRCIESISGQLEKYDLGQVANIYVANDASPDNTTDVVTSYADKTYFSHVSREANLGMNQNIKSMLLEAAEFSDYQLIITDDDYLEDNVLNEIVEFLVAQKIDGNSIPLIWTPRYSYTEDHNLHTVVCNPFDSNQLVNPSVYNAGKYMFNGFILSGLIIQAKFINYEFWDTYKENAYFPILFFGDLLAQNGAYYWNRSIVHHTVLNECHWERWGKNDAVIDLRLFSDFANAFSIMRRHIRGKLDSVKFYLSTFSSIYRLVAGRLMSGKLNRSRVEIFEAVSELKQSGFLKFELLIKFQIFCALILAAGISLLKLLVTRVTLLFTTGNEKKEHFLSRIKGNSQMLSAGSVLARSVLL